MQKQDKDFYVLLSSALPERSIPFIKINDASHSGAYKFMQ